jgi:ribonuclease HI
MARTAVTIYSDGACLGNPGRGGYGTVLLFGEHRKLKRPCDVTLWSDSQYVVHAMTKGWLEGWQKKGWRTSSKEPVKNRDLWERLLRALGEHEIQWQWVRGHTGDVENERCDQLAVAAANGPDLAIDAGFDG